MGVPDRGRTLRTGLLVGVGLIGTLDEVVLHQVLDWHHFVDRPGPGGTMTTAARELGLLSDGLFHLASTALLAWGLVRLANEAARLGAARRGWWRRTAAAGVLLGAGGFNLYDGVVQHKLLGLHQVRRGVDPLLPYDVGFIGVALLLLAGGVALLRR